MKLIAIEGIDGCGKSTVINFLKAQTRHYTGDLGFDKWLYSPEPSPYTFFGKLTREYLGGNECIGSNPIPSAAVLPLMMLARFEMISAIEESTKEDDIVILDRYTPSTLVYQQDHYQDDVLLKLCYSVFPHAAGTIWIDTPPEVCLERMKESRRNLDMFEKKEKLVSNRNRYLNLWKLKRLGERRPKRPSVAAFTMLKKMTGPFIRIDGTNRSKEELGRSVTEEILKIISGETV